MMHTRQRDRPSGVATPLVTGKYRSNNNARMLQACGLGSSHGRHTQAWRNNEEEERHTMQKHLRRSQYVNVGSHITLFAVCALRLRVSGVEFPV